MVKSYLRYVYDNSFGVVASEKSNALFHQSKDCVLAANEERVIIWNTRNGSITKSLNSIFLNTKNACDYYITQLCLCKSDSNLLAVGFSNGKVEIFAVKENEVQNTFHGHKSSVSTLCWSKSSSLLASGGLDNNIVIWSVINGEGVCKLQGHKDAVTKVCFLYSSYNLHSTQGNEKTSIALSCSEDFNNYLISSSKDGSVRIWDLCMQVAVQIIFDFHTSVWTFAVHPNNHRLLVGSSDNLIRVYNLKVPNVSFANSESSSFLNVNMVEKDKEKTDESKGTRLLPVLAHYLGSFSLRSGRQKVCSIIFCVEKKEECMISNAFVESRKKKHANKRKKKKIEEAEENVESEAEARNEDVWDSDGLVLCVSGSKTKIDIFRVNSIKEQKKRKKIRIKRLKEKLLKQQQKMEEIDKVLFSMLKEEKFEQHNLEKTIFKRREETLKKEIDLVEKSLLSLQENSSVHSNAKTPTLDAEVSENSNYSPISDEFTHITSLTVLDKICFVDIHRETKNSYFLLIQYMNNHIEIKHLPFLQMLLKDKTKIECDEDEEMEKEEIICRTESTIDKGHRRAINNLDISRDDSQILSISLDCVKVWNATTLHCIKSIQIPGCTCGYFLAGNEEILLGRKEGIIELYNIEKLEQGFLLKISEADILSIAIHPNLDKFAALAADSSIRFFEMFEVVKKTKLENNTEATDSIASMQENISIQEKRVEFKEVGTRPLGDKGVDLQYSPDSKFIVVSLLDNTMQIFYTDSLKLFLTLYGHKLPVCTLHISSDSTLLASGSADKSIKIWGMDFGNIHKSFRAHNETVSKLCWIRNTHYLISISHDCLVEIWDADTYELICKHIAHHLKLISLALSFDGSFFITAGEGRCMRIWRRTSEQLFIEEEREKELEAEFEKDVLRDDLNENNNKSNIIMQSTHATIRTIETVKSTEMLMEVIDEAETEYGAECEYNEELEKYHKALEDEGNKELLSLIQPPIKKKTSLKLSYLNLSPHEHVLNSIASLNSNTIYEVLIALPFSYCEKLLRFILIFLEAYQDINILSSNENDYKENCKLSAIACPIEPACKTVLILVQIHFRQFISSLSHRRLLISLRNLLRPLLNYEKNRLEFNSSALSLILRENKLFSNIDDDVAMFEENDKLKKKNKSSTTVIYPCDEPSNKKHKNATNKTFL